MAKIPRIMRIGQNSTVYGEIDPSKVMELVAISEVNGENALRITTTQEMGKGDRLLYRDGRDIWHEYVIEGIESTHDTPGGPTHTYYCPWSLQHDLEGTYVTGMPGTGGTPATATQALTAALAGTNRWTVGTVNVSTTGSASFWHMSGWEALQELVSVWGGEVNVSLTVGARGVTARRVDLLVQVGEQQANRRFDYGHDVCSIVRTVHDQLWTCRVLPLGAGEETDSGGYGRKITIESVNGDIPYLENSNAVIYTRIPSGNGWEYPCQIVENSECKTPADLKAWAQAHLDEWTTPKVSYTADVVQLAQAGLDPLGVSCGDVVAVVDRTFTDDGLRITARVLRMEEDLIDPSATVLTISNLQDSLAGTLDSLSRATSDVRSMVTGMSENQSSAQWVSDLLERINAEANATGGYTYITEGEGIRCYDHAVSDPLVGAEASAVCEVKGGTMRIANTKDSQGNWQWKTVFISGRILAELIDAIGSSSGYHAQLTPTGLDVYDGTTAIAHFGATVTLGDSSAPMAVFDSDHLSLMEAWYAAGRTAGDKAYIKLASGCRLEIEIGSTRDITRLTSGGPLYLSGYDGVYAVNGMSGNTSSDLSKYVTPGVIRSGVVGQTNNVQPGDYVDVSVSFGYTYSSAPKVVVGLNSTSQSGDIGMCSVAVASVSTTGFTARIFNASNGVRSPGFYWIAT